jgi:hypothetical protein
MKRRLLILSTVLLALIAGCTDETADTLNRVKLFHIDIGKMEDQLDMLQLRGTSTRHKTRILMRNGLFYIANGNSSKIMEFTSYGDILSLFYNPNENPEPFLLKNTDVEGELSNRRAFTYPFREIGEIGITSDKTLFVEDRAPKVQEEYDQEIQAMLNRVVLRFDGDGNYLDYLGQEGIGGTPFPYIQSIHVTSSDEIVVISRSMRHWISYWFNSRGTLLYKAIISRDSLPVPGGSELLPSLGSMYPDIDEHLLYLKIDYFGNGNEGDAGVKRNVHFHYSRIWWYDLDKEKFTGWVDVPVKNEEFQLSDFDEKKEIRELYELLGTSRNNIFFLMTHHGGERFELILLRRDGSVISRNFIEIPEQSVAYRVFHLAPSGVLSALLVHEYSADIVWWRTDKYMEDRDEDSDMPDYGGD